MSATAAPTSGGRAAFKQITDDHTVVAEQLAAGHISPADAATHPQRSMLTRVLGISARPRDRLDLGRDRSRRPPPDLLRRPHRHGRGPADRGASLRRGTPEEAVWALIEEANNAGGHDNVTVVVVDVER